MAFDIPEHVFGSYKRPKGYEKNPYSDGNGAEEVGKGGQGMMSAISSLGGGGEEGTNSMVNLKKIKNVDDIGSTSQAFA